tara:strand:- start:875 stop:1264 length:390 start_codon:yes stop_codon:yes gene_type:complete
MDHIVKQIVKCNTITEKLVRITYLKTIYRCPTKAEIEYDEYDYDEENHHAYYTTQKVCILSVHGSKYDEWSGCPLFIDNMEKGKIHDKRLDSGIKEMNRRGIWTETSYDTSVHNEDHFHLIITKVEMMN